MKRGLTIANNADHKAAVAKIDALFDKMPEPDSREGRQLKELIRAVDRFEDKFYPISFSKKKKS